MKNTLLLFALILLFNIKLSAQNILISENFTITDSLIASGTPSWSADFTLKKSSPNSIRAAVGNGSVSSITTLSFNTSGLTNLSLSFWHICKIQIYDTARVEISTDNGVTWQTLPASSYNGSSSSYSSILRFAANSYTEWDANNNLAQPNNSWWKQETFNLNSIGLGFTNVKIRFILKDGVAFPGANGNYGWVIDDVKIIGSIAEITPPTITFSNPIYQNFVFNNTGPYTVKTVITDASGINNAKLYYSVNSGNFTAVSMTNPSGNNWEGIIPAVNYNDTVNYYVTATDNSLSQNVARAPESSYIRFIVRQTSTSGIYDMPFIDDFETQLGWTATPSVGSIAQTAWEYGKPNYQTKNSVYSGLNCWSTNKNVPYSNNSNAILTSPPFDFSNAQNIYLFFYSNFKTYDNKDGMRLEYSLNNGNTWQVLGTANDTNWYNTADVNNSGKPGFTGDNSGWKKYQYRLSMLDFYNTDKVRFRFVFTSDGSNIAPGFSIDDFGLTYDLTTDVSITQIITPTNSCTPQGIQKVKAVIKNTGAVPIKDSIPVAYRLNNLPSVVENFYLELSPGHSDTITFSTPINIPSGSHLFRVLTVYTPDIVYNNDLKEISFTTVAPKNIPYQNNFEANNAINDFCFDNGGQSTISVNSINPINGNKDLLFDSKNTTWTINHPSLSNTNNNFIWNSNVNTDAQAVARLFINSDTYNKIFMQLNLRLKSIQDTTITNYFRIVVNGVQISPTFISQQNSTETNLALLYDLSPLLPDKTLNIEFQSKNAKDYNTWGVGNFIDDLLIYSQKNRDLASKQLITNVSNWPLAGDSISSSLEIKNFGSFVIDTNYVKLVVNNIKIDSVRIISPLFPNQISSIGFTKKFALKQGLNIIKAISIYPYDQNRLNDTITTTVYAWPYINVPYVNSFDTSSGYFYNRGNNQTQWQWSTPTKGYLNSAYSSPKAWVLNNDTNYFNRSRTYLYTPVFNFSAGKNPTVSFYQKRKIEPGKDGFNLQYTIDGQNWIIAGYKGDPKASNWYNSDSVVASAQRGWTGQSESFEKSSIRLPQLNYVSKVQFRFYFASNDSIVDEGIIIDDFNAYIPEAKDLGISRIFTPITSINDPNKAYLKVQIRNYGQDTIYSAPVSYKINNGLWVTETWNGVVYPFSVTNHTFITPFIIPPGNYQVCATTGLSGDQNHTNDTLCNNFYGIPVLSPNYVNNFDDTLKTAWTKTGNVWEFGTPAATNTTINAPYSPPNCWKTKLTGNYPDNATDYLYTPYFNLSCSDSVVMSFMHRFDFESGKDGGIIEYTKNRGISWIKLDTNSATNWYNQATVAAIGGKAWSGNSGGWKKVIVPLTQFERSAEPIRFRFKFSSDAATNKNGWAIDNFNITAKEKYDIALNNYAINPTINYTGDVVKFKIGGQSNEGFAVDTLNFKLIIDIDTIIEQVINNPPLGCNDMFNYQFNYNYTATPGIHQVKIYSFKPNNKTDINTANDTIQFSFITRSVNDVIDLSNQNKKCFDFETDNENWLSIQANTGGLSSDFSWERGKPTKTLLNNTKWGNNAMVTDLINNYPANASLALVSPPIILDSNACYNISFWHIFDMEQPFDGGTIEYSTNKGNSWQTFGTAFEPNWMNTPKILSNNNKYGWSGTSNGWVYSSHVFKPTVITPINFRFVITSNNNINKEGWGIDNICIEKLSTCFVNVNTASNNSTSLKLYPNPANQNITFELQLLPSTNSLTITIHNLLGEVLVNNIETITQPFLIKTININEWPSGIYFYTIKTSSGLFTGKFIKQ